MKRTITALMAATFALTGLSFAARAQTSDKLKVVTTFSILGDLVHQIGGDRIEVSSLVGPDGDAHVYSPSPADAQRLAEAKVVFTNGLHLEGWIDRLIASSGTKASVVQAARGVKPLASEEEGHGGVDPHAWQDIANVKIYVAIIHDALIQADPADKTVFDANLAAYLEKLSAVDQEIKNLVARIPLDRRKIITSHDAFQYFHKAYGIAFIAPQGVSTEAEASAKDVGKIIRQIKAEAIPAIFVENISDPRLMERIARETGAKIGERVYSDALSSPDGPAGTYIDMMRHNIRAFSAALSS